MTNKETVNLFWTGGFDSTARLCALLLQGRRVLPIYVLDRIDTRMSREVEIRNMADLRSLIEEWFPEAKRELLPTLYVGRGHGNAPLVMDKEIAEKAKILEIGAEGRMRIGEQYKSLCSFAKNYGEPVEIGIEVGGRAEELLRFHVVGEGGNCRVSSKADDLVDIFSSLRFPLIRKTKQDIWEDALRDGYDGILLETWSCWHPTREGDPCGRCFACKGRHSFEALSDKERPYAAMTDGRGIRWSSVKNESAGTRDICILLTTYNRERGLLKVLDNILRESDGYNIHVAIWEDPSEASYPEVRTLASRYGWDYTRMRTRYGKRGYTRFMRDIFLEARRKYKSRYFYFMQDDIELCSGFFKKTIDLWEKIEHPKKASLFLLKTETWQEHRWTGAGTAKDSGHVYSLGWLDCNAFLFQDTFLTTMQDLEEPGKDWFRRGLSSGAGRQMSNLLYAMGYKMFGVKQSHVLHREGGSFLNPGRTSCPKTVDLVDGFYGAVGEPELSNGDMVTASVASIPEREQQLGHVVKSILPQVGKLCVYLNGYEKIPRYLRHDRIVVRQSQTCPFGDQGDAGKFYYADNITGFHFTLDDDLAYPGDYVKRTLSLFQVYGTSIAVAWHGSYLEENFKQYYKHKPSRRVISYSAELSADTTAQIAGTGTLAYHTDALEVSRDDFKHPNMADIWFSLLARSQDVPIVLPSRGRNWIGTLPGTQHKAIFTHSRGGKGTKLDTSAFQTEIVKENMPWSPLPLPPRRK